MIVQYTEDEQATRAQATKDGVTHFVTGVAIFRDDQLLIVRRVKEDYLGGVYELPGGGVDADESFMEGAAREALEETGLVVTKIIGTFPGFDYSTTTKPKVRQLNYLVTVAPGTVTLEPSEHDHYRWIDEKDVETMTDTTDKMAVCLRDAFAVYHLQNPQ
jgi:8-oxo-dGTP diphosphatase